MPIEMGCVFGAAGWHSGTNTAEGDTTMVVITLSIPVQLLSGAGIAVLALVIRRGGGGPPDQRRLCLYVMSKIRGRLGRDEDGGGL